MSEPETLTIDVNGFATRVWRKGSGPKLGFLAGFGGLPRWMPFLDELAQEPHRDRAVAARLPRRRSRSLRARLRISTGCSRCARSWSKSDLEGADLAGSSVGASLAAGGRGALARQRAALAVIAPFGLFDEKNPPTDPWAQRADAVPGLMCADPEIWKAMKAAPEGANSIEWPIEQTRANEAAARIFWPLGNTRIEKRLRLIKAPTLLLWGEHDQIMPRTYAETFAKGIAGRRPPHDHRRRRPSGGTRQARGRGTGNRGVSRPSVIQTRGGPRQGGWSA